MTTNHLATPAAQFHFLTSGVLWHARTPNMWGGTSEVSRRGQTVTITQDMLEASPWIARYLGDEEAQIAKWGEVRIAPGAFPDDLDPWTPGTPEAEAAYWKAHDAAWAETDPAERDRKLRTLREQFGAAPSAQRSSSGRSNLREVEAQRARLDALGRRQTNKSFTMPPRD
jgi:hypothetical protein